MKNLVLITGISIGAASTLGGSAHAQSCPSWLPTFGGVVDLNATARDTAVFNDGTGDALYVGGEFTTAGGVVVNRIAKWTGSQWTALGAGFTGGPVIDLEVFDDGQGGGSQLYAAGAFTGFGTGGAVNRIARWDGTAWSPVGVGFNGNVEALEIYDDGLGGGSALFAAGSFTLSGGTTVNRIAKWNGTAWVPLGTGLSGSVFSLAVYDDGLGGGRQLFAGGSFNTAGGSPASNVARWNGTTWSGTGGSPGGFARAMVVFTDGSGTKLYVGGDMPFVNRWNGFSWSSLPLLGTSGETRTLAVHDDGLGGGPALYAGGLWGAQRTAKWTGSAWQFIPFGGSGGAINALDSVALGGLQPMLIGSAAPGSGSAPALQKYDGSNWLAFFSAGLDGSVHALQAFDDGLGGGEKLYIGGTFTAAAGAPASRIVRWDDPGWTALGAGMNGTVRALAVHDDGLGGGPALYAGGNFTTDLGGGVSARHVARWDGAAWSTLGGGLLGGDAYALTTFDDGSGSGPALFAAGSFTTAGGQPASRIAKWDGATWSPLGSGVNGTVRALAVYDDGSGPALFAAGDFTTAGGISANRIARWDGVTWSPLGSGCNGAIHALVVYDKGLSGGPLLVAGGDFSDAGGVPGQDDDRIAAWDGQAWLAVSFQHASSVRALAAERNGQQGAARLYFGDTSGTIFELHGNSLLPNWVGGDFGGADVLALTMFTSPITGNLSLFAGSTSSSWPTSGDAFLARRGCVGGSPPPWNDECFAAPAISNEPGSLVHGSNVGATTSAAAASCSGMGRDVWFRYQAPCNGLLTAGFCDPQASANFDTVLALYSGACGSLAPLVCADDVCGSNAEVSAGLLAGQVVYIAVGGKNGAQGEFTLHTDFACNPPPSNDEPAGALPLSHGVTVGSNVDATTSAQSSGCAALSLDVWYRYVAPAAGGFRVGFCAVGASASFDTVLAVYSDVGGNLTQLACNDDSCGTASSAALTVSTGQVLYVAVGGKNFAQGSFNLAAEFTAGDTATTALQVSEGLVTGSNAGNLLTDPLAGSCGGTEDLWFAYLPSCTGAANVGFCAPGAAVSGFDPVISVFSDASGTMTEIACNDNRCGVFSSVAIAVVAGQKNLIRVASKTGATGSFTLSITCQPGIVRQTELLGMQHGSTGSSVLLRINTFPFSVATVGNTGIAGLRGLETLAGSTDTFAGSTPAISLLNASLYKLNLASGAATVVGTTTVKSIVGLSSDASGFLLGAVAPITGPITHLARFAPANAATTIVGPFDPGGVIKDIQGLANHPTTNVLYGTTGTGYDGTSGDLFTIDKATGAATLVGSLTEFGTTAPPPVPLGGLAIDDAGAMYGSLGNNDGRIVVIDPAALTYATYGDTGTFSVDGLSAPCPGNEIYGKGCSGSGGFTPLLSISGCSNQGSTITLSVRKALGGSMALLLLGLSQSAAPLSQNCTLNVAPILPVSITLPLPGSGPGNGAIAFPSVLPPVASPVSITLQALVADAAAPKGIAASNGFELEIR